MEKNSPSKPDGTKANALLCPSCCVEYVQVEFDLEVEGVVLDNVKALRCPGCNEELFTPEQYETIRKRISDSTESNLLFCYLVIFGMMGCFCGSQGFYVPLKSVRCRQHIIDGKTMD